MYKSFKKPLLLLMLIAVFTMTFSGTVLANGNSGKAKKYDRYHPQTLINVETAVSLIVSRLNLNIDHMRFIKKPEASDYFTKVKDNDWHANNFIIAYHSGLGLPKDINPNAKVTREEFTSWLYNVISHKRELSWIEIYIQIADDKQIKDSYKNSIQKMLIAKIVTLDGKQKFNPKNGVTRSQAEVMIERTKSFIKKADQAPAPEPAPIPEPAPETPTLTDVKLTSEKATDEVTKVTITAMAPHPGYGFEIASIQFNKGEAIINYRVILPDPDKMYIQVISEVKLVTYIPATYTPVLGKVETVPFSK